MQTNDKDNRDNRQKRSGFTLVELLLVVTIIGVLATVVLMNTVGIGTETRITTTRASIGTICQTAATYEIQVGRFPESLDDLCTPINERKPLLKKGQLNDSWGTPFSYKMIGKDDYEVRSAGPDAKMGTEDDITN
jgi:general secretion pathway protein G